MFTSSIPFTSDGTTSASVVLTTENGSGVVINSGGTLTLNGAQTEKTTINANGSMIVNTGAALTNTLSGGYVRINGGHFDAIAGSANGVTVNGGTFNVSGGAFTSTLFVAGVVNVFSGGVLNTTTQNNGTLNLSSGGVANGLSMFGGNVSVSGGANLNNLSMQNNAVLVVNSGATVTAVSMSGGVATFSSGASLTGFVHSGGRVNIDIFADVQGSTVYYVDSLGRLAATGTKVTSSFQIQNGSVVSGLNMVRSMTISVSNGKTLSGQNLIATGAQVIGIDGSVQSTIIWENGIQTLIGGSALQTVISGGRQIVSGGGASNTVVGDRYVYDYHPRDNNHIVYGNWDYYSGIQVLSGGSASRTTVISGGTQLLVGGTASDTVISSGGYLSGNFGAAKYVVQHSGGIIQANVKAEDYNDPQKLVITGENDDYGRFYLSRGVAQNMVIYSGASQNVSSGAIANSTHIFSGAVMNLSRGGLLTYLDLQSGGILNLTISGGDAKTAVINGSNGEKLLNGVGSNFVLYSNALLNVTGENAVAAQTKVYAGGSLAVSSGASSFQTQVYSGGTETISANAIASGTVVKEGGLLNFGISGSGYGIVLSNGGISADVTATANNLISGTYMDSGVQRSFLISGAYASAVVLYDMATLNVSGTGASAEDILVSGGLLRIRDSAVANDATVYGGHLSAYLSGSVVNATVFSGGTLTIGYLGVGLNERVFSGGSMIVQSGGTATGVVQSGGQIWASLNGETFGTLMNGAVFSVSGGVTTDNLRELNSFGLIVEAGQTDRGVSLAGSAARILNDGGALLISSGGEASNTTINSGGVVFAYGDRDQEGGVLQSGVLNSGGRLVVSSGGSAIDLLRQSGGIIDIIVTQNENAATYYNKITGYNEDSSYFFLSNGITDNFWIYTGGSMMVANDGQTNNTHIESGARLYVEEGGKCYNIDQKSGGILVHSVYHYTGSFSVIDGTNEYGSFSEMDGVASNFAIYSGGTQTVDWNGVASNTHVGVGGLQLVSGNLQDYYVVDTSNPNRGIQSGTVDHHMHSGTAVSADIWGTQILSNGGLARNTIVYSGGIQYVLTSGNALVNSIYGAQLVSGRSAFASNTVVFSGGVQNVQSLGIVRQTTVSGGNQIVESGAQALNGSVTLSGVQKVYGGGVASDTVLLSGGTQMIYQNADVANTMVQSGGVIDLLSGAEMTDITLSSGGGLESFVHLGSGIATITRMTDQYVLGSAVGVNFSGSMLIASGASAINVTANDSGSLLLLSGATASGTTVSAGGTQTLENGAVSWNTRIVSGGFDIVESGATANSTTVSGGLLQLSSGATASATSVVSGGSQILSAGAYAGGAKIGNDGNMTVFAGASAEELVLTSGAQLELGTKSIEHIGSTSATISEVDGSAVVGTANGLDITGSLLIASGASALNTTLDYVSGSSAVMQLVNGAYASGVMIKDEAILSAGEAATLLNLSLSSGASLSLLDSNHTTWNLKQVGNENATITEMANAKLTGIATNFDFEGVLDVVSGGSAYNNSVESGAMLLLNSGAYASSTLVKKGAIENVSAGAVDLAATLQGNQTVYFGAAVSGTVINAYGSQVLLSGAGVTDVTVNMSGAQILNRGAYASGTVLNSLGVMAVDVSASAGGITLNHGGVLIAGNSAFAIVQQGISSGTISELKGSAVTGSAVNLNYQGVLNVAGTAIDNTIGTSGRMNLSAGAKASGTVISGVQLVSGGATAERTTIVSGGSQHVSANGLAVTTVVQNGAVQTVDAGAVTSGLTLQGGKMETALGVVAKEIAMTSGAEIVLGSQYLMHQGSTSANISELNGLLMTGIAVGLDFNGLLDVASGAKASNTVVESSAKMILETGASAASTTVKGGGSQSVLSGAYASGTTVLSGGVLQLAQNGSAAQITVSSGAQVNTFRQVGATAAAVGAMIGGNINGETLNLDFTGDVNVVSGGKLTGTTVENGGVLTVSGGASASINAVKSGAILSAASGALLNSTGIVGGGRLLVTSGASALNIAMSSGAKINDSITHLGNGLAVITELKDGIVTGIVSGMDLSGRMSVRGSSVQTTVRDSSWLELLSGAVAGQTTVLSGGTQSLSSGTLATGTTILAGGVVTVNSGASITSTTISQGGRIADMYLTGSDGAYLESMSGGVINGRANNFEFTGTMTVGQSGLTSNTTAGGTQQLLSGGSAIQTYLNGVNAQQIIEAGAVATVTQLAYGTTQTVRGIADRIWAEAGASVVISGVGSVTNLHLSAGASVNGFTQQGTTAALISEMDATGISSASNLNFTGTAYAAANALLADTVISIGGTLQTAAGVTLSGVTTLIGNWTVGGAATVANLSVALNLRDTALYKTSVISNISQVSANNISIVVDSNQATGSYSLAGGASSFKDSVALVNERGVEIVTLSAGESYRFGNYTYSLTGGSSLTLSIASSSTVRKPESDINGNGISDIVLYNDCGLIGSWMDGQTTWNSLYQVDAASWDVLQTGDFDGNGTSDILVYWKDWNYVGIETTDKTGSVVGWTGVTQLSPGWSLAETADLDGNGCQDLLMYQNGVGTVGAYMMKADGSFEWQTVGGLASGQQIAGSGDFNGNGKEDILIQNVSTDGNGELFAWNTNGYWTQLATGADASWEIAGVGDFNGTGKDDILLYSKTLGVVGALEDNSSGALVWRTVSGGIYSNEWKISTVGDYDGDGKDDMLLKSTDGTLGYWSSADSTKWTTVGGGMNDWKVIA